MAKELSAAHQAMASMFNMTDPHSYAVYKFVEDVYPAFAEKLFKNGTFMEQLVMSNYNPMDVLDYPICGRCETLAAWDGTGFKDKVRYKACKCFNCGTRTTKPVTLRYWMRDELKKKAPLNFQEIAEEMADAAAMRMLRLAQRQVDDALVERFKHLNPKMGQDGEDIDIPVHDTPKPKVQVKQQKLSETYEDMLGDDAKGQNVQIADDVYMEDEEDV